MGKSFPCINFIVHNLTFYMYECHWTKCVVITNMTFGHTFEEGQQQVQAGAVSMPCTGFTGQAIASNSPAWKGSLT